MLSMNNRRPNLGRDDGARSGAAAALSETIIETVLGARNHVVFTAVNGGGGAVARKACTVVMYRLVRV